MWNLLCNILLPVLILNKGHWIFPSNGAFWSLILALAFPLAYGIKEYTRARTVNALSIIGLVSVILTGALALMNPGAFVFVIKEALIPLIIALFILATLFYKKPLMYIILMKSSIVKSQLILERIKQKDTEAGFHRLMKQATLWLSGSFLLSAGLNFVIAFKVFSDIDPKLPQHKQSQILNGQIADMTWMGYIMIALPLSILMIALIWHIAKQLKKLTSLKWEEMIDS